LSVTTALMLTGGLMVMFSLICCWGMIDVIRAVRSDRSSSRLRDHRLSLVAYVLLVVLIPEAAALFFGWLFIRVISDR
jgi:hypothetical protein